MHQQNIEIEEVVYSTLQIEKRLLYSDYLEREVEIDIYIPLKEDFEKPLPLLFINDGQDLMTMNFARMLDSLFLSERIAPIICVGIHCGADRINEYGTAFKSDYKGRGAKAGLYNKFIFDELEPLLKKRLAISSFREKSFAGFSLGGLSALDIAWNRPHDFSKVGVFSGALWWRRRGYEEDNYNWDTDRLMHLQVQKGTHYPWLKFFFECGLLDETADRNNNGIIDSIEDTLDLIEDLKEKGYKDDQIHYLELQDGEHNVKTWAKALPVFLKWGWGKNVRFQNESE